MEKFPGSVPLIHARTYWVLPWPMPHLCTKVHGHPILLTDKNTHKHSENITSLEEVNTVFLELVHHAAPVITVIYIRKSSPQKPSRNLKNSSRRVMITIF